MAGAAQLGGSCVFKGKVHLFTSPSLSTKGSEKKRNKISIRPFFCRRLLCTQGRSDAAACPGCLHGDQAAIHITALAPAAILELPISLIILYLRCGRKPSVIPSQSERSRPSRPSGQALHSRGFVRLIQVGLLELVALCIKAAAAPRHLNNTAQAPCGLRSADVSHCFRTAMIWIRKRRRRWEQKSAEMTTSQCRTRFL